MDSNKSRLRKKREQEKNLNAFSEIIDVYYTLKCRSVITPIESKFGKLAENISPCKPSISDFFCDVDNVFSNTIDKSLWSNFSLTYFEDTDSLTKSQKRHIEQKTGKLLRVRGIYPVKKYFTVTL